MRNLIALLTALTLSLADRPAMAGPAMSWGTWNSFGNAYDSATIQAQATALQRTGLFAAGYRNILLDEGWWLADRDADGNMTVDAKQWPALEPGERAGDITNIVRWLHKRGFTVGTYTDAGPDGCSSSSPDSGPKHPNAGSYGHYRRDFGNFVRWGFDYVKVDWCGGNRTNLDPMMAYQEVARAIADAEMQTGRHMLLSLCNWGHNSPWDFGPGVGGRDYVQWRSGGDITDPIVDTAQRYHLDRAASLPMIWKSWFDGQHPEGQHTGYFNDLDMMVIGLRGTDPAMDRLHMTLWAIAAAPMMIGADVTKLTPDQIAVHGNADAIAINQDADGLQGFAMPGATPGVETIVKPLPEPGHRALAVIDRRLGAVDVAITPEQLGFAPGSTMRAREVWSGRTAAATGSLQLTTQPQVAQLWLVDGTDAPRRSYPVAVEPVTGACADCTMQIAARRYQIARVVAGRGRWTRIIVRYRLAGARPTLVRMQVGDATPTTVQLRPAGRGEGSAVVVAKLPEAPSDVRFWPAGVGDTVPVTRIEVAAD